MNKIEIEGGYPLKGRIKISGAKNASLPLMAACLLTDKPLTLQNLPDLVDIRTFEQLLSHLGVESTRQDSGIILRAKNITETMAPYDLVRKMRASVLVLGPVLARMGEVAFSLPGGCAIGTRPIDLHIKGLEKMGAEITLEDGYVRAKAPRGLRGAEFTFPMVSVTGTENLLMAATLAKGTTRLINASCEPEVIDLAHCLKAMGASIEGIGTHTLTIEGKDRLDGAFHTILPDRIETGTYAIAAAMTEGELTLEQTSLDLLPTVVPLLEQAGLQFTKTDNGFHVKGPKRQDLAPLSISTAPYPGFPTDLQAQIMALMCLANGPSTVQENIFENRFMHVPELCRMGAMIEVKGSTAIIDGVSSLRGAPVMATDLRASVSLVLAGLAAEGKTLVGRIYHLDRGYEHIENKLVPCGAHIKRIRETEDGHSSEDAPKLKVTG